MKRAARPLRLILAATSLVLAAFAAFAAHAADPPLVFAASSLNDCLTQIGRDYQKATGQEVRFNFAASSVLARQIQEGAPADLFFSADEAKMDALAQKDLIDTKTRVRRLSNTLVVIVPLDSPVAIRSAADLVQPATQRIALADPASVPAGIYAKAWLQRLGIWTNIAPKVVTSVSVRAALAAVESGNVEAGIVFKTDAAISKKVMVACSALPADTPEISYPVALLKAAPQPAAAQKFLDYLNSDPAAQTFIQFGFIVLPPHP